MAGFITYGITDPRSRLFCYVGQTRRFDKRQQQHLTAHRLRKAKRGSVQHWLKQLHKDGYTPLFTVLEIVETEEESLVSESKWVEKIAALGHPLLNRWEEHQELIDQSDQGVHAMLEPMLFTHGNPRRIGTVESNANKTGLRVHLDEGIELSGPVTIDLLPPKIDDV